MALTDYLINAIFLVVVLRQARERRMDIRSIVAPMALVVFVATHYVMSQRVISWTPLAAVPATNR